MDIFSACTLTHTHLTIDQAGRLLGYLYPNFLVTFIFNTGNQTQSLLACRENTTPLSSAYPLCVIDIHSCEGRMTLIPREGRISKQRQWPSNC